MVSFKVGLVVWCVACGNGPTIHALVLCEGVVRFKEAGRSVQYSAALGFAFHTVTVTGCLNRSINVVQTGTCSGLAVVSVVWSLCLFHGRAWQGGWSRLPAEVPSTPASRAWHLASVAWSLEPALPRYLEGCPGGGPQQRGRFDGARYPRIREERNR